MADIFSVILIMMAIFLNQSSVIFGVNISFADFFFLISIMTLILKRQFKTPSMHTIFFIMLTIHTIFTSLVYVPVKFYYAPGLPGVAVNYVKLAVVFMYFIFGCNIPILAKDELIVKWYSYTAVIIGLIGVLFTALSIRLFSSVLYYGEFRYKGLMNDPNFFAVIQASAIPYFSRTRDGIRIKNLHIAFTLLLVFSILASGSKTGMITLLCYLALRGLEWLLKRRISKKSLLAAISCLLIIVVLIPAATILIQDAVQLLLKRIPAFERIILIFTDFDAAVSDMGSSRDLMWVAAVSMIKMSPVMGVGLGTYSDLSKRYFGVNNVAHNTYLQLLSEWGIIFSSLLFLYLFFIVGKITLSKALYSEKLLVIRDMVFVFLIGSFAVSLNNARMFWLFFGILVSGLTLAKDINTDRGSDLCKN